MASTGIRFDDGSGGFSANCFPVRKLKKHVTEASGAWLEAHRAEQRRRFKAVLCAKPREFEEIRKERIKAEKEGTNIVPPTVLEPQDEVDKVLDGFFLMKHCCVEDPADLCSIKVDGQNLSEVKEEDFQLFDNVAYVNAAENLLSLEGFKNFPIIRELELGLNGLRGLKVQPGDFPTLEMLDLSYNNLAPSDMLTIGLIPKLRVLHVSGNGLTTLPTEMSRPHLEELEEGTRKITRYPSLEILLLDDNRFQDVNVFAALAGLKHLRHLNLSKNQLRSVPQLMLVEGRHVTKDPDEFRRLMRPPRSARTPRSARSRQSSRNSQRKGTTAKNQLMRGGSAEPLEVVGGTLDSFVSGVNDIEISPQSVNTMGLAVDMTGMSKDSIMSISEPEFTQMSRFSSQVMPAVPEDSASVLEKSPIESLLPSELQPGSLHDSENRPTGLEESESQREQSESQQEQSESQLEQSESQREQSESQREQSESDVRVGESVLSDTQNISIPSEAAKQSEGSIPSEAKALSASMDSLVEAGQQQPRIFPTESEVEFTELNLEQIDQQVTEKIAQEKEAEENYQQNNAASTFQEYPENTDEFLPPPFPELGYLDISDNLIEEQEALLSVGAWPVLSELIIVDNPLVKYKSGDPPMLKRYLQKRLGIHIQRKKEKPISKPIIEIVDHPSRRIRTKIYPVPRCNVDELLALEAPPRPPLSASSGRSSKSKLTPPLEAELNIPGPKLLSPLPPIGQKGTALHDVLAEEDEDADDEDEEYERESTGYQASSSLASSAGGQTGQPAFFMTETEAAEDGRLMGTARSETNATLHNNQAQSTSATNQKPANDRYHGYEELLNIDDKLLDKDIPMPKDVIGNVQALKYALSHPLVFRDNKVNLYKPQNTFNPWVRSQYTQPPTVKTKAEKAVDLLDKIKTRQTYSDVPLSDFLKQKHSRLEANQTQHLVDEVQRKYNTVRVSSIKNAPQGPPGEIVRDMIESLSRTPSGSALSAM